MTRVAFALRRYCLPKFFGKVAAVSNELERLAKAVRLRREELGLRQDQMRNRGGPSTTKLTEIERAMPPAPTAGTLRKLDVSLGWAAGSAAAVLAGGEPRIAVAPADLTGVTDEDLLAEVMKRMEARHGMAATQESYAPGKAHKDEKSALDDVQAASIELADRVDDGAAALEEDRQRK